MKKPLVFPSIIFLLIILSFNINSYSQQSKLYFCEDYVDGKEINMTYTFANDNIVTVMVDLRPDDITFQVNKIYIAVYSVDYDEDNNPSAELLGRIPFDVEPDWDFTCFKDPDNFKFTEVGSYLLACQTEDGTTYAYNILQVVDRKLNPNLNKPGNIDNKPLRLFGKEIDYYSGEIKKDPGNKNYYMSRANYYDKAGLHDSAIADYNKCISLGSINKYIKGYIAWNYFHKKSYDEALKIFQEQEKKLNGNLDMVFGEASTYFELKNYDKAKSNLDKIIKIVPEFKSGMSGFDYFKAKFSNDYANYDIKATKEMLDYFGYK